jgi:hypothetical protein
MPGKRTTRVELRLGNDQSSRRESVCLILKPVPAAKVRRYTDGHQTGRPPLCWGAKAYLP